MMTEISSVLLWKLATFDILHFDSQRGQCDLSDESSVSRAV